MWHRHLCSILYYCTPSIFNPGQMKGLSLPGGCFCSLTPGPAFSCTSHQQPFILFEEKCIKADQSWPIWRILYVLPLTLIYLCTFLKFKSVQVSSTLARQQRFVVELWLLSKGGVCVMSLYVNVPKQRCKAKPCDTAGSKSILACCLIRILEYLICT